MTEVALAAEDLRDWADALAERGFLLLPSRSEVAPILARLGHEGTRTRLKPVAPNRNRSWSHSDINGFGSFPWHTDGAVAPVPPRWMVLECEALEAPSSTELLRLPPSLFRRLRRCSMRVRGRSGRVRDLAAVVPTDNGQARLRWDPRVCHVNDSDLAKDIEAEAPTATCEWHEGRLLLVDNWRMMHRRPAVLPGAERTLIRSYIGGA